MSAKSFPNKYAAQCTTCGARVAEGQGLTTRGDGKWLTTHVTCPTTDPAEKAQPEATQATITPTPEQAAAIALFATGQDLVIEAGAGTGKTATLLQIARQAQANGRKGKYFAYNKDIVRDVRAKVPGNVSASTVHALAFAAIGYQFTNRLPGEDGMSRQRPDEQARILGLRPIKVDAVSDEGHPYTKTLAAGFLATLVLRAVDNFAHTVDPEVTARHFTFVEGLDRDDEFTNNNKLAAELLPFARKAWADVTDVAGGLRITHDIYLKSYQLSRPRIVTDFILLDEAQDADPVQVDIILAQQVHGTQIVVVGDSAQVLYEWRGAVNALADFAASGANVTYLTQSFRFGDAVAEVANGLLTRLGAELRLTGYGEVASTVGPVADPKAILARTNAGAVRALLAALEAGQTTHLVGGGKDVTSFCRAALALQDGRHTSHAELGIFASWAEVEAYVETEEGSDLKLMVKLVTEFGADTILEAIAHQPVEDAADVVISTAHKSKGRQWTSVQIAGDFKPPKEGQELSAAELRLAYVAATRAQHELDLSLVPHFLGEGDL